MEWATLWAENSSDSEHVCTQLVTGFSHDGPRRGTRFSGDQDTPNVCPSNGQISSAISGNDRHAGEWLILCRVGQTSLMWLQLNHPICSTQGWAPGNDSPGATWQWSIPDSDLPVWFLSQNRLESGWWFHACDFPSLETEWWFQWTPHISGMGR